MPDAPWPTSLLSLLALLLAATWFVVRTARRDAALRQLEDVTPADGGDGSDGSDGRVVRWLARAGRNEARALSRFWTAQAFALVAGALLALLAARSPLLAALRAYAFEVPGGLGGLVLLGIDAVPLVLAVVIALVPVLQVRRARRLRIAAIERDLPVLLDLLATLGEAGLGFDAALDRVLRAQPAGRPLVREMRMFQQDVQAGMARWRAFRRLGRRCDVASVSMFTSALIQSEQIGSGLAKSLRSQSVDHWNRRREQALARAQSLPARLSVPLVVCFLPALFVITLGPILLDFIELADSVIGPGS